MTSSAPAAPATDAQGRLLCTNAALALTTTVGAPVYGVGQTPILGVTVRNAGPVACVRDLSGELQVFTAYDSKGSRIWSTADCFPGSGTDVRVLQPGESLQYNIKWSGTTSQPGCAGDRLRVEAGTYSIVARVGGAKATAAKLTFG